MRGILLTIISVLVVAGALVAYRMVDTSSAPPVAVTLDGYPVKGVDISSHNGEVDFVAMRRAGIDFVFIKASEGGSFKDPRFHKNCRAATAAGLRVGAYHFFRFDTPGYMQALNVMHSVRHRELDLPVVIDLEEWTNPKQLTTEAIITELFALVDCLEQHGYRVMLYTNKDGYHRFVKGRLEYLPLWLCSFVPISQEIDWTFRQYTHRGTIPGVKEKVDLNVFNGSRDEWEEWCLDHPVK
ncbi:MAG: hypothetical protein LIO90_10275 [Bacteroidales bacterium]|nr:hypothetical protein [Bacteroidales bacterium]